MILVIRYSIYEALKSNVCSKQFQLSSHLYITLIFFGVPNYIYYIQLYMCCIVLYISQGRLHCTGFRFSFIINIIQHTHTRTLVVWPNSWHLLSAYVYDRRFLCVLLRVIMYYIGIFRCVVAIVYIYRINMIWPIVYRTRGKMSVLFFFSESTEKQKETYYYKPSTSDY